VPHPPNGQVEQHIEQRIKKAFGRSGKIEVISMKNRKIFYKVLVPNAFLRLHGSGGHYSWVIASSARTGLHLSYIPGVSPLG